MSKRSRYTAVILAALILTVSFSAAFFALHEHTHSCVGENCPLCAASALCRTFFKALYVAFTALSAVLLCLIALKLSLKSILISGDTPVMLKVKMTD